MDADFNLIAATDVGGTFTDVLAMHPETGRVLDAKVRSTPPNFGDGIRAGVRQAIERFRSDRPRLPLFFHATTVGTNSILEHTGPRVALIVTKGFRDVLEIGRGRRPELYNIGWSKPIPLVPRDLRLETPERMGASGAPVVALDEDDLRQQIELAVARGAEALAITFLHSYANDSHERAAGRVARACAPTLALSLSADVCPERGEFERISTTVLNSYLKPTVSHYLNDLTIGLEQDFPHDSARQSFIMQSNGGVVPMQIAKDYPSRTIESGPAAGVRGAQVLGGLLGERNLIAFDMGGTTAKASLIENGAIFEAHEFQVGHGMNSATRLREGDGYIVRVPCLDVAEVGLGGGTIVHADELGVMHLGPRSAGANPGPVCYGFGGTQPTVTDAHVVLGEMRQIAGGTMALRPDLALQAFTRLSQQLRQSNVEHAARMVLEISDQQMTGAIRAVTTERGRDPADFVLFAYGGAGPLHAALLAERLGVRRVVVPPYAGVFSAAGLLAAPLRSDVIRVVGQALSESSLARARQIAAGHDLSAEGKRLAALRPGDIEVQWSLVLRFEGQTHMIAIPFASDATAAEIEQQFRQLYQAEFSYLPPARAIEVSEIRGKVEVNWPQQTLSRIMFRDEKQRAPIDEAVYLPLLDRKITFVNRARLAAGGSMQGPFIVEDLDSTTVVPPGWRAELGAGGTLWLHC
jgi:N-methylhydantoinase A